jgi:hypothetical protein|tara:strand:+ start:71 stop:340 length:270 start_codon:yes stop_codon:yes gene_type:complete
MGNKLCPYMTDEEVMAYLAEYDEQGFEAMPDWLKQELQVRDLPIPRREPTDLEKWEAGEDAKEHRHMNNERTIEDFKDKYKRGRPFKLY